MNGRTAKKLRKEVYGEASYKTRRYANETTTKQTIMDELIQTVDKVTVKNIGKRALYQAMKKEAKRKAAR